KEEFGLIDPPKRMCDLWSRYSYYDHLFDLNGEVGYVCCRTMEVWVLNKQKEWVPHCRFEEESVPDGYIDVIGCWNKDGDILIKCRMRGAGSSFMDRLPSNIIFNIFSRVPVKCLARSLCVSKVWCSYIDDRYLTIIHDKRVVEEPTPILYHQHLSFARMTCSLCFHVTESIQTGTTHYVLEPKERAFLEYLHKKSLSRYSIVRIKVRGSCNGLI
nr:hypothetical protein [Tanacetum cinerariifolium]